MKQITIGRCYNQPPIVLTKDMGFAQIAAALKALEGHEVTHVSRSKAKPQPERDPWHEDY
jgi:hypothetical protein